MKRIYLIITFILVLSFGILGITYSYEYNEYNSLVFELVGPYEINLKLNDDYYEYGVKVLKNGVDVSNLVNINRASLDTSKVGEYTVRYELLIDGHIEYINRVVNVREYIKPIINIIGDEVIYLNLYDTYIEYGYEASDNYDIDIESKVITTSNLMIDKVGEYKIEYKVSDSSGNEAVAVRRVIVK